MSSIITNFGNDPALYDAVRPRYPKEVVDKVVDYSGINKDSQILEVGVGTGQISEDFLASGFGLCGLEPDPNLHQYLVKKFSNTPNFIIKKQSFEEYQAKENHFNLFLSAQAFHWVEPVFGLNKAIKIIKRDASIALVWQIDRSSQTDFYKATTPIFDKYITNEPGRPKLPSSKNAYQQLMQESSELKNFELFSHDWEKEYSTNQFIGLLNTFSGHISLESRVRESFNSEIAELIKDFGGSVKRLYSTVVLLAKKL